MTLEEAQQTLGAVLEAYADFVEARAKAEDERMLPERTDHARRVRWFATYNAVLNARHLAGDAVAVAHDTSCAAAIHAHGPMPDEFILEVPA